MEQAKVKDFISDSPVCVVLRRYFESLQEQGRVIAEQRSMAMIGENDIVQEG